jgi:hypothetical protein
MTDRTRTFYREDRIVNYENCHNLSTFLCIDNFRVVIYKFSFLAFSSIEKLKAGNRYIMNVYRNGQDADNLQYKLNLYSLQLN